MSKPSKTLTPNNNFMLEDFWINRCLFNVSDVKNSPRRLLIVYEYGLYLMSPDSVPSPSHRNLDIYRANSG